jgi:aromatic ring hydroxylase
MIFRGGKQVLGFALGAAAADPYAQAASDLADMQAAAKFADTQAGALDYTGAVKTYQTTGANGVAVLGPEIDTAGAQQATQQHTQHAQMLNDTLAGIAGTPPATAADAANARGILGSMLDDYLAAIQAGRAAQSVGKSLFPLWQRAVMSAGIVVIGLGGVLLLMPSRHGMDRV